MAVLAPDLTTLANLKEFLGIASADTSKDTALEKVIDRVTLFIEGETQRKLKARKYNNGGSTHTTTTVSDEDYVYFSGSTKDKGGETVIDPNGYGLFYLPAYPVRANVEANSIAFSVAILSLRDSTGETWDTTSLVENENYLLNRETGELRHLYGPFAYGVRNYRVTMCAGYLTGAAQPYVPADLEGLCLELCKQVYKDTRQLQSESIGTWSRTFNTVKEDEYVQGLLSRFSRVFL